MSGVSISPYTMELNSVKWTASWDDKGNISFKGIDKDGKEVGGGNPPPEVQKAAREYGANQGGIEQKSNEDTEDKQDTSSLKKDEKSNKSEKLEKFQETMHRLGAKSVSYNPKDGTIIARDKDGKSIIISSEDRQALHQYFDSLAKDKKSIKDEFKTISKELLKDAKELAIAPFRLAKDLYKAGKLIAQGKFRELRSRAALRIHDNLVAMDVLPKEVVNKIANEEKHENRLLDMKITANSGAFRPLKRSLASLSGRTGSAAVAFSRPTTIRDNSKTR